MQRRSRAANKLMLVRVLPVPLWLGALICALGAFRDQAHQEQALDLAVERYLQAIRASLVTQQRRGPWEGLVRPRAHGRCGIPLR